jgi:C4-dicarboxylate transporter DctM subunit
MLWQQLRRKPDRRTGLGLLRPRLLFVVLVALAVPVWAAIGAAAILMLVWSGALPLSLVGEKAVLTASTPSR